MRSWGVRLSVQIKKTYLEGHIIYFLEQHSNTLWIQPNAEFWILFPYISDKSRQQAQTVDNYGMRFLWRPE